MINFQSTEVVQSKRYGPEEPEPKLKFCTVRESSESYGIFDYISYDLECRFENGEKFAAVKIDGDYPELALLISALLNRHVRDGYPDIVTE